MSRFHRFILLCLLAVAIPFQGFAAVTMGHGMAAAESAVAADQAMAMDGDDCEHVDEADASSSDAHAAHADHKGSCSACAACYSVAAPGFTFAAPDPVPAPAFALPRAQRPRVAFLTDGPDRPPRSLLA